jgi:hypothetical protein
MKDKNNQIRSPNQNRSIHKWCQDVADGLNEKGIGPEVFINYGAEIDFSMEMVKALFRKIGYKKFGKKSTSDLTTKELMECHQDLHRFLITPKINVNVEFPSIESLLNKSR